VFPEQLREQQGINSGSPWYQFINESEPGRIELDRFARTDLHTRAFMQTLTETPCEQSKLGTWVKIGLVFK